VSQEGSQAAVTAIHARSGTWYDPQIASVLLALCANGLLLEMGADGLDSVVRDLEPAWLARMADAEDAERIRNALIVPAGA
jgi:hypothetical protein